MSQQVYIIKTGSSFAEIVAHSGDFEHWIASALHAAAPKLPIVTLAAQQLPELPAPDNVAAIIITGSHAMVSELNHWSERLVPWLQQLQHAGVLMLGICYGHQLLAHAFGGQAGFHPEGIEIGSHTISLLPAASNDPLFNDLPEQLPAQLVHRQSAITLPLGAVCLARNAHEAHQAFRLGETCWGVQFHPEFSAEVMRGYIRQMDNALINENIDTQHSLANVCDTPASASILLRFAELIAQRL